MTPGYLHNMSVPPLSRVTAARAFFSGLRFRVTTLPLADAAKLRAPVANALDQRFQRFGGAFALALLEVKESPARTYPQRLAAATAEFSATADAAEQFSARCLEALRKAGVPDEIGVFARRESELPTEYRPPRALELAILARRSGCLYLPQRPFDASLISWSEGVLFFPEGSRD